MKRTLFTVAVLLPFAASAQGLVLHQPSIGDALREADRLAELSERGVDQVFVLPERAGQNQVAWYGFNWEYVDVPPPGGGKGGIRLYYYRSETDQARRALPAIESAYARLVDQFHYSPTKRIPYILFATQREFQTQNVFAVTESVLGVTSPADLKMAVPYFGDHQKFVEVSTHEMVHQFTIQKLLEAAGAEETSSAIQYLPLWFIEGIAEYYSKGGIDTETDLFLRDLVWNPDPHKGYEIVPFAEDRIRGYIPTYKLGQARCAFIADTYGKEKIQGFLENAYLMGEGDSRGSSSSRSFGALVRRVLNEPLEQVDQRWRAWLKRRYYPEYIRAQEDLPQLREIRGLPNEPESFSASSSGNVVAVRAIDRERGRARLLVFDLRNPGGAQEIASDSAPGFESLHPIEYSIAAVGSNVVVFSAQAGIGDQVYVQRYREVVREGRAPRIVLGTRSPLDIRPPGGGRFIQVEDPALSPDEKQLAFVGVASDGRQDIYVADIRGGTARRVTNDPYSEKDLAWGSGGIYFASDATDHGRTNLFRVDPVSGERTRLTTWAAADRHPAPQADGSVLFSSNLHGKSDIYALRQDGAHQITDFTTGLVNPASAPKGRGVLAGTFYGGVFRLVEVPKVTWLETPAIAIAPPAGDVLEIPAENFPQNPSEYDAFAARNWKPEAGFVYGGGGGNAVAGRAAALFADTLRDHVLFVDVSVLGSFNYVQGLALYQNRGRRLAHTFGAFHFVQQNIDQQNRHLAFLQRDFGVVGSLRYPLDRFRRVELELEAGGVQRWCVVDYTGNLVLECRNPTAGVADWNARNGGMNLQISPTVRFGYDTIRYTMATGPLAGSSLVAELGGGFLPGREAVHGFARFDAEHYFQLGTRANLSFRAAGGASFAPNERSRTWERSWWLSSADNLRGFYPFDLQDLIGLNYWVTNAELQFPLDSILRLFIFDNIEAVAAVDFGGVFNQFGTKEVPLTPVPSINPDTGRPFTTYVCDARHTTRSSDCVEPGAWDSRTLTGVLGVNVFFGPLLLRVHFGHPWDVGGLETQALRTSTRWVTNVTLRYAFF